MGMNREIRRLARNGPKENFGKAVAIAVIAFMVSFAVQAVILLLFGAKIKEIFGGLLTYANLAQSLTEIEMLPDAITDAVSGVQDTLPTLLTMLASFLIVTPITLGANFIFYLNMARMKNPRISDMFKGYKIYGRALGVAFMKGLFLALWMLLYLVVGILLLIFAQNGLIAILGLIVIMGGFVHFIVKLLSYSLAEYFVLERPDNSVTECIGLSKSHMSGRKGRLFGLMVSIYWPVLAAVVVFAVGISVAASLEFHGHWVDEYVTYSSTRLTFQIYPWGAWVVAAVGVLIQVLAALCGIYFNASRAHFYLKETQFGEAGAGGAMAGYYRDVRPMPNKDDDYHKGITPFD